MAMDALTEVGGTPLEHPSYSPDLATCDFWAFLTMKMELPGQSRLLHYPPEACGKRSAALCKRPMYMGVSRLESVGHFSLNAPFAYQSRVIPRLFFPELRHLLPEFYNDLT
jgi:hypothetical protein